MKKKIKAQGTHFKLISYTVSQMLHSFIKNNWFHHRNIKKHNYISNLSYMWRAFIHWGIHTSHVNSLYKLQQLLNTIKLSNQMISSNNYSENKICINIIM